MTKEELETEYKRRVILDEHKLQQFIEKNKAGQETAVNNLKL